VATQQVAIINLAALTVPVAKRGPSGWAAWPASTRIMQQRPPLQWRPPSNPTHLR